MDLPRVTNAVHLGHELHQTGNMKYDAKVKRASFIEKSTEIREMFSFAHPIQILQSVSTYAAHFYGSMLWNLYGHGANSVFRSWNTCVKLCWGIPRWSHNYFVEHALSPCLPHVRQQILCQYLQFVRKLLNSDVQEVKILANIVARDIGSVTGGNLSAIGEEFNIDPWTVSFSEFSKNYTQYKVPDEDSWRLPFLVKLLEEKMVLEVCGENIVDYTDLIASLCSS